MNPADFLITNGGDLDPAWLPDAVTLLSAWVTAVETANPDAPRTAIEACVYAKAYAYLLTNRAVEPSLQRDRDKTASWSPALLQVLSDRAAQWDARCRADTGGAFAGPVFSPWEGSPCCEG